jgi:hypothetical protein
MQSTKTNISLGYGDMITTAMNEAFTLAENGRTVWQHLSIGPDGSGNPPNAPPAVKEAESDLLRYMFLEAVPSNQINAMSIQIDDFQSPFKSIDQVFQGVLAFQRLATRPPDNQPLPANDVIVYCDYSRYTLNYDCAGDFSFGSACDKDTQIVTSILSPTDIVNRDFGELKQFLDCQLSSVFVGDIVSPPNGDIKANSYYSHAWTLANSEENQIAQIQLCQTALVAYYDATWQTSRIWVT